MPFLRRGRGACKQRHVDTDLGAASTPLSTETARLGAAGGAAGRRLDRVTRLHSWPVCQRYFPPPLL